MLKSRKHVFWEALFLTVVVFFFGLLLGVAFESSQLGSVNEYYMNSEISLMDVLALSDVHNLDVSCDLLIKSNIDFADRIYEEALILENYEKSKKITDDIKLAHKKYDLLRTFLWVNSIDVLKRCGNGFNTVVYLYDYEPENLEVKATQGVWSKILYDLKHTKEESIILIPIAVDGSLESVNLMMEKFGITQLPVVILNDEKIVDELSSVSDLEEYIN